MTAIEREYQVILDRRADRQEGSYTCYLFDQGIDKILKKVGEECTEMVIAAKNNDKDETVYEITDLIYHTLVMMANQGITPADIQAELDKRAEAAEQPADGTKFPGGEIVRNLEADRLQILFDEKPDDETRQKLKERGFRWSPRYNAWQRKLTDNAMYDARRALGLTE